MIFPTTPCVILPQIGNNENGQPLFGVRVKTACAIVKLSNTLKKTSIRTDRSASQGNAKEITADSVLLFLPTSKIKIGDAVEINGLTLYVEIIQRRYEAFTGKLDHIQAELTVWR